jgi:hypothetical protein
LANTIGMCDKTIGCCCFNPTYIINGKEKIYPKLGEVHFIKGHWSMEVVVHELTHALFYIMSIWPLDNKNEPYEKETLRFGYWVDKIYRELWKINPNPKWKLRR